MITPLTKEQTEATVLHVVSTTTEANQAKEERIEAKVLHVESQWQSWRDDAGMTVIGDVTMGANQPNKKKFL